MKKRNAFAWYRLMRTMVALLVILSMLLCGCVGAGDGDGDGEKEEANANTLFGDGDGKLEAQDAVDSVTNIYGALLGAFGGNQPDSYGYEMDLVVTLGDALRSQLGSALEQMEMDSDMSWFENVGIGMEMATNGDLVQMAVDAQINGKSIVSAETVVDYLGGMVYIAVPEINSQYIAGEVDFSQMQNAMQAGSAAMEEYADLIKDLPTDKELNSVLTRYLNVVLETMNEPTTGETELTAAGITKTVTATTYSFTRYNVLDIATQVLTTAKTDAELEKVLDAFSKVVNEQGAKQAAEQGYVWTDVDLHAQLMEAIDPALEDIQDSKEDVEDLEFAQLVIYTDGDDPVGGKLVVSDGYSTMDYVIIYSLKDGKNTALVANIMGTMQLTGSGTVSGSKISGEYTLLIQGQECLNLEIEDFDTKAFNKGELKGTVRLSFGDALLDSMGNNALLSEDTVIELELNITGKKAEIDVNLYQDDILFFGIAMSSKTTSGGKIKVPADYVKADDSDAAQAWLENAEFANVLSNLKSAGVPTKLVDLLEQSLENAMQQIESTQEPVATYPGYGY